MVRHLSQSIKSYFLHNTVKSKSGMSMSGGDEISLSEASYNPQKPSAPSKEPPLNFNKINSIFNKETLILLTDLNGEIIYINDRCSASLGYQRGELMGKHSRILRTEMHSEKFYHDIGQTLLSGEIWKGEITAKTKDGSIKWYFMSIFPLLDENQLLTVRTDITYLKETHMDLLTGLPNHRSFEDRLNKEIEYAKENHASFTIVRVGLDDFRLVNSTFGYATGNQFLKDFTGRMKSAFDENVFFHKTSGDNFIILIKNMGGNEEIQKVLDDFLALINEKPFKIEGKDVHATVSMGVGVFPYSGETVDELLKNAEIAMFHAKTNGKNQYQIFSSNMSLSSYKQFVLRNDSKKALLKNEFDLFYQPRLNPMTDEIEAAEALIRWNHPEWGLVLPDEFISMAEDSGLIIPIGEWLIRRGCQQLKTWEKEKVPIKKISINLSPLQLLQANFTDMVASILNESNVHPKWIEFEITENVFIENEEQVLQTLTALKNMGITISLDDFGTGYSSLHYLRKLPCDIIKIDKSLIRDIHRDTDNFEIISSIISLCHKLNKSVVAEGVELEEQLALLRKLHCNEIQGYFYSKPVDEARYKQLLIEGIGVKEEKAAAPGHKNKREYFRVPFKVPLLADMTIDEIENNKINIGSTEIHIKDIGLGGLCFSSPLKLPARKNMILQFTTEIFSTRWRLKGKIVWQKEVDDQNNQYGVEFILNDVNREELLRALNKLQVRLKQKTILHGCRFAGRWE